MFNYFHLIKSDIVDKSMLPQGVRAVNCFTKSSTDMGCLSSFYGIVEDFVHILQMSPLKLLRRSCDMIESFRTAKVPSQTLW